MSVEVDIADYMESLWPMQREVIARMMLRGCTFTKHYDKVAVGSFVQNKPVYTVRKEPVFYCFNENGALVGSGEDVYAAAVEGERFYAALERENVTPSRIIADGLFKLEDE